MARELRVNGAEWDDYMRCALIGKAVGSSGEDKRQSLAQGGAAAGGGARQAAQQDAGV